MVGTLVPPATFAERLAPRKHEVRTLSLALIHAVADELAASAVVAPSGPVRSASGPCYLSDRHLCVVWPLEWNGMRLCVKSCEACLSRLLCLY
jgi:hypothetical protein